MKTNRSYCQSQLWSAIGSADTSLVLTDEQLDEYREAEHEAWLEYLAGRDAEPEVDGIELAVRRMPCRTGRRPRRRAHRRAHRAGVAADGSAPPPAARRVEALSLAGVPS